MKENRGFGTNEIDTLGIYMKEVREAELLSEAEERRLGFAIKDGRKAADALRNGEGGDELQAVEAAGKQARDTIVERNLRLVLSFVKRYVDNGVGYDELVQAGNLGLVEAANIFDPDKGRFSTIARVYIKRRALEAVKKSSSLRIPDYFHSEIGRYLDARSSFINEHEREPTLEELAAALETSPDKVVLLASTHQGYRALSLDLPAGLPDGEGDDLLNRIPANALSVLEEIEQRQQEEFVRQALNNLPPQEKEVITKRFGLNGCGPVSRRELAREMGISPGQIRRMEDRTINFLKRQVWPATAEIV